MSKEKYWERLRASLPEKYADEIVDACKYLHGIFDSNMIDWFANLYDPESGGFYFSNSVRDAEGYGADAESVIEMFMFLERTGMTGGRPYEEALPEWLKRKVGEFVYGLQKPDGYFYHPQHNGIITDLRRARDLGTCQILLEKMGFTPKYRTPDQDVEEGSPDYDINQAPEQYRSFENYKKYLEELDIPHKSYYAGSILSSDWSEVVSFGNFVGADYRGYTLDLIDSLQRPENGLWHEETNQFGVNGAHKMSYIYHAEGRKIPYVDAALDSTLKILLSPHTISSTVDICNPWHVLAVLVWNKKEVYGATGEELDSFMDKIYSNAAAAIRNSADKLRVFKAPDGGMSYTTYHCCALAYGLPSAVSGSDEGDINGACCGSVDVVQNVYHALGLDIVPLYTEEDLEKFISIITEREKAFQGIKND